MGARHRGAVVRLGVAVACLLMMSACQAPERTMELARIDQATGYRPETFDLADRDPLPRSFVVASFSGGGTRAAALALGALRGLEQTIVMTETGGTVTLMEALDMVSSVSGGSVTAAHLGLYGAAGFSTLEQDFLRRNVQGKLVLTALNPVTWVRLTTPSYARIDALIDYFDENVFAGATYADLHAAARDGPRRRPFIVLNAADMDTGSVFSFTQDQFDLICADLARFSVADAVASSAAFPGALTAVTLKNRSPCLAQAEAPDDRLQSGWRRSDEGPAPTRLIEDTKRANIGVNPGRFRRGRQDLSYLNRRAGEAQARSKDYVQLLDGGIVDNLGLTYPLRVFTDASAPGSVRSKINLGEITRAVFVAVNARSDAAKSIGTSATPPGLLTTLGSVIGTPIDGSSFLLLDQLQEMAAATQTGAGIPTYVIAVDFDFIEDPACRQRFKNIATSWALPDHEIDALLDLGHAMVQRSPAMHKLVADLGGNIERSASVKQACARLAAGA